MGNNKKNPRINQNYGYGAIHENVPKLRKISIKKYFDFKGEGVFFKIAKPTRI